MQLCLLGLTREPRPLLHKTTTMQPPRTAGALRRRPSPLPSATAAAVTAAAVLCCSLTGAGRAVAFSLGTTPAGTPVRHAGSSRSSASKSPQGIAAAAAARGSYTAASSSCVDDGSVSSEMYRRSGQGLLMMRRNVGVSRSGRVLLRMSVGGDGEEEDEEAEAARAEREFESIFDKNSDILDVPLETFDESRVEPLMPGSARTEMPVFMLDVSACPGGVVPLHIFEMRYRQMFNDIGTKDNRFGMLVSDPTTGRPCKYGAVMECAQRKLLPDGRQYVLNQAVERFRVLKVLKSAPYTIMEVEVGIPDNKPLEGEPSRWGADEGTRLEDLELEVYATVNSVVELMNKLAPPATPGENRTLSEWFLRYSPKVKRDEGLEGESAGDDLAKQAKEDERRMNFSFAVAEMIAMESHTKQLLLQSRSTAYRLMAVREILVKAQKELAAKSSLKDTLG